MRAWDGRKVKEMTMDLYVEVNDDVESEQCAI